VGTPDATSISKVTLIALSSVTHGFNMGQRISRPVFSQATDGLNVTVPSNPNTTPPGYYMLFILNSNGVPSVAKIVQIGGTTPTSTPTPTPRPSPTPTSTSTPPNPPSALTADATACQQITLGWTDNSKNETGFKIERSIDGGHTYQQIDRVGANVTSYVSNLTKDGLRYYRVRSYITVNGVDYNSTYSNIANATAASCLPPPAAPTNLTATAVSSNQINLSWTDHSNNETGFKVERSRLGRSFRQIATVRANVTRYADIGRHRSTTYRYRVRAYNAGGNSAYSNIASATTNH
jgi:hypothetical protein